MIGVVHDVEQRTEAWHALRCGTLTGSRVAAVFATLKSGGEAAARRDLRLQLAVERLTQRSADDVFVSREMQRGTDLEPVALGAYEAATGLIVTRVGFITHADLPAGCSPDGLVEDGDGLGVVEVKCPKATTHLGYLRAGTVPPDYLPQCRHALWLTGAAWCDFISHDPRFPPALQTFRVRLRADVGALALHERAVRDFLREVDLEAAAVAALGEAVPA
jgi:hypothetical protein